MLPCGAFNFNFCKKNITIPQNYLSFPRGKSFLKEMLFHSLYKVSTGFGRAVFLKIMLGGMSEQGDRKISGGIYHG